MAKRLFLFCLFCLFLLPAAALRADTLVFTNGDQLNGTLVRADAANCVFHSDMAGTVTVPWSKVHELRTTAPFVVVDKDGRVRRGQLMLDGNMLEITDPTAAQPAFVAPADTRMVVDPKTYENAVTAHPALWASWRGQASGGFSQVSATQSSTSYTASVDLQRPTPSLAWLPQRSNTLFHFQAAYGKLSQTGVPTVRTSIVTTGLEQDQNLNARLFLFGNGEFDHNLAQGLELQQAYGGGVGWKLISTAATQVALRADLHWTRQRFLSSPEDNFLASSFTETLQRNFGKKLIWTQNLSLTPSYTNGPAYQMAGMSSWAVPLYHSLGLNFSIVDSYINNPQPGFQKNSLQFSTGVQYTLR